MTRKKQITMKINKQKHLSSIGNGKHQQLLLLLSVILVAVLACVIAASISGNGSTGTTGTFASVTATATTSRINTTTNDGNIGKDHKEDDLTSDVKSSSSSSLKKSNLQISYQFQSSYSQVYVIENFLPNDVATSWRQSLEELWMKTLDKLDKESSNNNDDDETCDDSDFTDDGKSSDADSSSTTASFWDGFLYSTNNNGTLPSLNYDSFHNNAKVRSLKKIQQRQHVAKQLYEQERFAYSKWELHPSHQLVNEIQTTLTQTTFINNITALLRQHDYPRAQLNSTSQTMSDIIATHYTSLTNDFLSPHDDGVAGTWAIVISLATDTYNANHHGGILQFQCPIVIDEIDKSTLLKKINRNNGDTEHNTNDDDEQFNYLYWKYSRMLPYENRHSFCQEIYPKFNTAILFPTRVRSSPLFHNMLLPGPSHHVTPIVGDNDDSSSDDGDDGGGRYVIAGWYVDVNDEWSNRDVQEREKVRGRN